MDLLFRSITVAFGSAAIAIPLASILALATLGRNSLASRCQSGLISSFLLLPSYVVAGAWSAGFGPMGWWTLSQVTAAKLPWIGIASVVWIHAMAATPVAYWLLSIGLQRCRSEPVLVASIEGGFAHQLRYGLWPTWSAWIAGSFLIIAAWVSGDMVVTNLFQVRTLVEQCYLDMMADRSTWSRTLVACSFSLGLGITGFIIIRNAWHRDQRVRQPGSFKQRPLGSDGFASWIAWLILLLIIGIPLANLTIKAGWIPRQTTSGTIERTWERSSMLTSVARAPLEFYREFQWSLMLVTSSATVAVATAASAVYLISRGSNTRAGDRSARPCSGIRLVRLVAFVLIVIAFALPGPVINSIVIRIFQGPNSSLQWLNDHTLAAPVLCLQFRLLPFALLAIGIFGRQWRDQAGDLWQIDADKPWLARANVLLRAFAKPVFILWILLNAVAFGELSCYLQNLPPGVTPIAMRIFDLLHYGVRSSEAGLLLFLIAIGTASGGWIFSRTLRARR